MKSWVECSSSFHKKWRIKIVVDLWLWDGKISTCCLPWLSNVVPFYFITFSLKDHSIPWHISIQFAASTILIKFAHEDCDNLHACDAWKTVEHDLIFNNLMIILIYSADKMVPVAIIEFERQLWKLYDVVKNMLFVPIKMNLFKTMEYTRFKIKLLYVWE